MFQKKYYIVLALLLVMACSDCFAETVHKVSIEETANCSDQELVLNGVGIRKKLFIKLYVAALYVRNKSSQAEQLLGMSQALCMRLHITSGKITSDKMINATREGFVKSTGGNTTPIADEIETFLAWLKQPIKKGDVFEFSFVPEAQTQVYKNNQLLGEISNKEFSAALFGIWLGASPVQDNLKTKLLGK